MASAAAILLSAILCAARCFASDTITANSSISGSQTVVSKGGGFELGFYHPAGRSNYYIGIWYKKTVPPAQSTPVWIANRATPLTDPASSHLAIASDGNLVLTDDANRLVWTTNISSVAGTNGTVAVILDSGNLVLQREENGELLWQSMDHPTDTWLPGAHLGLNKVTGEVQMMAAWKNYDDPTPGMFTLGIDTDGTSQYFLCWNKTVRYWSSGEWNGNIFTGVPEMMSHFRYNFDFVSNANVSYFTYSSQDTAAISRLVLDVSGQVRQLMWLTGANEWMQIWTEPHQLCDVHAVCGAFAVCDEQNQPFCSCLDGFHATSPGDWERGDHAQRCVRNNPLECGSTKNDPKNGKDDIFLPMPGITLAENTTYFVQASAAQDCRLTCLKRCNCSAYSYGDGCALWHGDLLNLQRLKNETAGTNTIYIRLSAMDVTSKGSKRTITLVGSSAAAVMLLSVLVSVLIIWKLKRRKKARFMQQAFEGGNLQAFKYSDVRRATNNFSEKLGGGGFGSVYKGALLPGGAGGVAVKRLESGLCVGDKQFRNEVRTIGTIHHVNLVRLRGFCSRGTDRLLVYDYMPNGSLEKLLFGESSSAVLSWRARYRIALGVARGLLYLHAGCRDCIIHCDVKPDNILLDADLVAKVADFGLAKLVGRDFSRVLTTMRGTIGYLAPEWISGVPITAKADVYSYGKVLLEIISGRRNTRRWPSASSAGADSSYYFPVVAAKKVLQGEVAELLDERLNGDADVRELDRACRVACWCVQDDEAHRPTMEQVVQALDGVLSIGVPPIPMSLKDEHLYLSDDFSLTLTSD